ncbi:MAG: thiol:disulfide interchange protein, partial [Alphaproteobacteria bacterium]|nr:thiol:disulfide interchange protein [Alphaproteobacteria bacterium]
MILIVLLLLPVHLLADAVPIGGTHHMKVALVAETQHPAPGKDFTLAVVMTPDPGWHGYWINPGEAGFAPTLNWTYPTGFYGTNAIQYPIPARLKVAGLMNHVFNGEHALLETARLDDKIEPGTALPFKLHVDLLVCSDSVCVPESDDVALNVRAGDGKPDPAQAGRFDGWRAALPRALPEQAHYQVQGDRLIVAVPYPASAPAPADPWLFVEPIRGGDGGVALDSGAAQSFRRTGDWIVMEGKAAQGGLNLVRKGRPDGPDSPVAFDALLSLGEVIGGNPQGLSFHAVPGIVPAGGTPVGVQPVTASAPAASPFALLLILGGALLGGLILNIMPCVFPVIGLKALSLAKGGADERRIRAETLAYTAGVMATTLALGGLLLALRAGGQAIGWAFQLQNPFIVFVLLLLMVAITLNLLGVYELRSVAAGDALTRKSGLAGD